MIDPFLIINKLLLKIKGSEIKSFETLTVLVVFPVIKSAIIIFPSLFVKYKFVFPKTKPIGFELLPEMFTLSQLQSLYEIILEKNFDKRNFRKKINSTKLLVDTGKTQSSVSHRPAKLFSFNKEKYLKLKKSGLTFEI